MGECDISQSVPFTICTCVSLRVCPYHGRVRYIPVCSIYHVCVYPYVHPITSYHGGVGHIPVRPILLPHVHVYPYMYISIPSQHTMVEWDISQSVPYYYHMYMCILTCICPSRLSIPWESGTHPSPFHIIPHV